MRRLGVVRRWAWLRAASSSLRDTLVLFNQFRGALLAFGLTVAGGGGLYFLLARAAGESHPASLPEAMFLALSMIFLQANADFPGAWYLQMFFFAMPLLGLAILSQGVADLSVLLFNRRARGEAWHLAVAATYSDHAVIIGLGHLGFRIARALHELGEDFVAVEQNPAAKLVSTVQSWNVPIISGDANKRDVLENAGVARARTVVIATDNDVMNLQLAIKCRAVNPQVRTIVRLFDEEFSREVCSAFGLTAAYSASALAAPAFAAAAAGLDVPETVHVNGRVLTLSHFTLSERSELIGRTIDKVEDDFDLSVVLLRRGAQADLHPHNTTRLQAGDVLTVFSDAATIHRLTRLNR